MYSFNPSLRNTLGLTIFENLRQEKKILFEKSKFTWSFTYQCCHKRQCSGSDFHMEGSLYFEQVTKYSVQCTVYSEQCTVNRI